MHTYQGVMGGRHGGHSQKKTKKQKKSGNRTGWGCKPTGHPHSACRGSCVASDTGTWLLWEVIMCFLEISTSCPTPESKQPFCLRLKLNRLMPLAFWMALRMMKSFHCCRGIHYTTWPIRGRRDEPGWSLEVWVIELQTVGPLSACTVWKRWAWSVPLHRGGRWK